MAINWITFEARNNVEYEYNEFINMFPAHRYDIGMASDYAKLEVFHTLYSIQCGQP